jgi:hypothetical protein
MENPVFYVQLYFPIEQRKSPPEENPLHKIHRTAANQERHHLKKV